MISQTVLEFPTEPVVWGDRIQVEHRRHGWVPALLIATKPGGVHAVPYGAFRAVWYRDGQWKRQQQTRGHIMKETTDE